MQPIAPGLVSLTGTDLENETLRAEHAQMRQQIQQYYEAYRLAESARAAMEAAYRNIERQLQEKQTRDTELFHNGRAKITATVDSAYRLTPKVNQQMPAVIGVTFTLRPIGLVIHDAVLRWDEYSLRLVMPMRMVPSQDGKKSTFANTVTLLGDNERDFLSHAVFQSLRVYLHQTFGQTVEQFGSGEVVKLPPLIWTVPGHKFLNCLRRADAMPFHEHFSLISSNYEYEKSVVLNEIRAAQAANTANDRALSQVRVIGSGFVQDSRKTNVYKQTF